MRRHVNQAISHLHSLMDSPEFREKLSSPDAKTREHAVTQWRNAHHNAHGFWPTGQAPGARKDDHD